MLAKFRKLHSNIPIASYWATKVSRSHKWEGIKVQSKTRTNRKGGSMKKNFSFFLCTECVLNSGRHMAPPPPPHIFHKRNIKRRLLLKAPFFLSPLPTCSECQKSELESFPFYSRRLVSRQPNREKRNIFRFRIVWERLSRVDSLSRW